MDAYELDGTTEEVSDDDELIYPSKIKKRKLKHAAQVLSQRVWAIRSFAQGNTIAVSGQNLLPKDFLKIVGTADFLLFCDLLFA